MPKVWEFVERVLMDPASRASDSIHRLRVEGGWIYRLTPQFGASSICFVPDRDEVIALDPRIKDEIPLDQEH